MDKAIVWLDQPGSDDPTLVGGKAMPLGRLWGVHPIPPAFCVTTAAYRRWADEAAGAASGPPPALASLVGTAYGVLAARCRSEQPRVAVRSSAVGEDGEGSSFAGQYTSFLNVVGVEAVVQAVAACWASAKSPLVEAYRRVRAVGSEEHGLAVLVQRLVRADVSCVVFSANAVTGNRDEIVVNANWGLGESIVSGIATPDTYVVGRAGLTDAQLAELATLAVTLEQRMGWPVDLECAYEADALFLLQCRPITSLEARTR